MISSAMCIRNVFFFGDLYSMGQNAFLLMFEQHLPSDSSVNTTELDTDLVQNNPLYAKPNTTACTAVPGSVRPLLGAGGRTHAGALPMEIDLKAAKNDVDSAHRERTLTHSLKALHVQNIYIQIFVCIYRLDARSFRSVPPSVCIQ